jgi:hypothetical protein
MTKLLHFLLVTIQIIFKLFLRLILLIFSLLGIGSAYLLTTINPDDLTLEALDKEVEKDCGHLLPDNPDAYGNCWEGWMLSAGGLPALIIIAVVFVVIGIPSIIFLYKLLKKDIIQLREKYKK